MDAAIRIDRLTLAARMARRNEYEMLEGLIADLERATSTDDVLAALCSTVTAVGTD